MTHLQHVLRPALIFCAALSLGTNHSAAATLCVNPSGASGCFKTIKDAVSAARPNDTVQVAAGMYHEDVVIQKSVSIIGAGSSASIVDATGLSNGFYIDGLDRSGLSNVVVSGFTIRNANFEGVVITNASFVSILENHVHHNDKSLNTSAGTCPGLPKWETAEGFDCGEGIHLSGAAYSTIAYNVVENNAGGILLSDETGATQNNLISRNVVNDNPYDCGITLASHPPLGYPKVRPWGVFRNTINGNMSFHNGLAVGEGAGVGLFGPVAYAAVYGNVVINNRLTDNGLPGVAFHAHTANQNLNDNKILSNYIAGNAADTDDAKTPGSTGINVFGVSPITGTLISQNIIENENVDIAVNTPAQVDIHLNGLLGHALGLDNLGKGTAYAVENWWGCAGGPSASACSHVAGPNVVFTPWLTKWF